MKKTLFLTALASLTACVQPSSDEEPMLGGDHDARGCISSAGQSWSQLRQECVQPFNIADIRINDPENETLAIYVILSQDKQQAEVFKVNLKGNPIFRVVKGGYLSEDGEARLIKTENGWRFRY